MQVEIQLFSSFKNFLPSGNINSFKKEISKSTTAGDILGELKLPEEVPKIMLINGVHATETSLLHEGDALSIFPMVSGG